MNCATVSHAFQSTQFATQCATQLQNEHIACVTGVIRENSNDYQAVCKPDTHPFGHFQVRRWTNGATALSIVSSSGHVHRGGFLE